VSPISAIMRSLRLLALVGSLAGVLALVQASRASTATLQGSISYASFASAALQGTMHYAVYLPAGYTTSRTRYPVVYFLHGLPAAPTSYRSIAQLAAAVEASGHPAIVIGVQGALAGDTDPEWRNWGPGRNWETATAKELVATVDARYRTIASRAGRVLIGISAGGYGATLIALHNPTVYAAVESWSGYFHATTPDGTGALDLGSAEADDWANAHKLLPEAKRFLQLRRAGLSKAVFRLYTGDHSWTLWGSHATTWIGTALSIAAKPT
jgi:enterochelin esterase-like enzyme